MASQRHSLPCRKLNNPDIDVRYHYNSTWIVSIIKDESSSFTSLCILNDFDDTSYIHAEEKFLTLWKEEPNTIFPNLRTEEDCIHRKGYDVTWYTLRSPCYDCVKLIKKKIHLFKSLTILTAAVYKHKDDDEEWPYARINILRDNKVKVEPMSLEAYEYLTKGRIYHPLPADDNFDPEGTFAEHGLAIAPRKDLILMHRAGFGDNCQATSSRPGLRKRKGGEEDAFHEKIKLTEQREKSKTQAYSSKHLTASTAMSKKRKLSDNLSEKSVKKSRK